MQITYFRFGILQNKLNQRGKKRRREAEVRIKQSEQVN